MPKKLPKLYHLNMALAQCLFLRYQLTLLLIRQERDGKLCYDREHLSFAVDRLVRSVTRARQALT